MKLKSDRFIGTFFKAEDLLRKTNSLLCHFEEYLGMVRVMSSVIRCNALNVILSEAKDPYYDAFDAVES